MGEQARKAIDELLEIGSGNSASLRELERTRKQFRQRLNETLSNLPGGHVVEVPADQLKVVMGPAAARTIPLFPEDRDVETESPGDFAAQEHSAAS